jgi:hypothetical protein
LQETVPRQLLLSTSQSGTTKMHSAADRQFLEQVAPALLAALRLETQEEDGQTPVAKQQAAAQSLEVHP